MSEPVWMIVLATLASQQPAPPRTDETDREIIVTGERVPRSLRKTASSVVVYTAPMIDKEAGADRLDQLLEQIPNVQIGRGGQGPTIRGQDSTGVLQDLAAFLGGNRPRITLQIDGRAASHNEFVNGVSPLWDIERIEVFRSPQSTTQGRNSIAGAIFAYTHDPTYDWEGRARIVHASLATWQGSAVVSGPLIDDQLAFRLAADVRTSRNPNTVVDSVVGANPNRDRYGIARAKLMAEPVVLPGLRLKASYVHQESRRAPSEGIVPPFEARIGSRGAAVLDNHLDSLTAEIRYDFSEKLTLTSTLSTGWVESQRFSPPGLGETLTAVRDRSIEPLLDWQPNEFVKIRIGLNALQTRLEQSIDLTRVFGLGEFVDYQSSIGMFGELELNPIPQVALVAGLRRQRDRQNRDGSLGNPLLPTTVDFNRAFSAWLPKLSLSYDVTKGITAGLLVQRAYNPGGVSIDFDTGEQAEFGQESLWSYEAFGRASLAGGRLRLTANLFQSDFRNAQRAEPRALTVPGQGTAFWALIHNIAQAQSRGLEASVDWRASGRLMVRGGIGILRTRIGGDAVAAFAGKQFGRSPRFSGTASIEWRPAERLLVSADVRHHSGYFSDDLNTPDFRIGKATVANARAAYDMGPITPSAYVRNLFDSFYLTSQFSSMFATAIDPREIGVEVETRF